MAVNVNLSLRDILNVSSSPNVGSNVQDEKLVGYQLLTYLKYEFGCQADEVKKVVEKSLVQQHIDQLMTLYKEDNRLRSLDIGCATGRYPTWFASMGYEAHGYDIEDTSILICQERNDSTPNVYFEKRNILEDDVEPSKFHIVTCMMGTFNHIPADQRQLFLDRVFETLVPGGIFIFSSWNPECPYTSYLQFYSREQREYLQANSLRGSEITSALNNSGFSVEAIDHFGFLPNKCYDSWAEELDMEGAVQLDATLREQLSGRNSQMYLVVATKNV